MATLMTPSPDAMTAAAPGRFHATVTREHLQRALGAVTSVIPVKSTLPILSDVLVQSDGQRLAFTGTDLDLWLTLTVPADNLTPGRVAIGAKKFAEYVRELGPSPVRLSEPGEGRIVGESGRSMVKLRTHDVTEYPSPPQEDSREEWTMPVRVIQELAQTVACCTSSEESRPILNGVLWELRAGATAMVATDGHKLARYEAPLPASDEPRAEADLIVPPKFFDLVRKLFAAGETVTITRGAHHLTIESDTIRLSTRLIEGPYPDYRRVIPTDNDRLVTIDRVALLSAIRRMATLATSEGHRLVFEPGDGVLRLSVTTPDLGEATDEVPAVIGPDVERIAFNAAYLLLLLAKLPTHQVQFAFKAPDRAALLRPVLHDGEAAGGDAPYAQPGAALLMLQMPIRLL